MNRQSDRIRIAWVLLSVFVSMLLLSGVHRHEAVAGATVDCMECAHHVHHSGHFTAAIDHVDDCLLCQFLSLAYTAAATIVLVSLAFTKQNRGFFLMNNISQEGSSVLFTRGPPLVL